MLWGLFNEVLYDRTDLCHGLCSILFPYFFGGINMNNSQKLTPKYWVVHNPAYDDVLLYTAHKSRMESIEIWFEASPTRILYSQEESLSDYLAECGLLCDLVEIKLMF
jgi:hypothetical protein